MTLNCFSPGCTEYVQINNVSVPGMPAFPELEGPGDGHGQVVELQPDALLT